MSGRVFQLGNVVRQAKNPAARLRKVSPDDVSRSDDAAKVINEIIDAVQALRQLTRPPYVEFEDLAATVGGKLTMPHNFGGRVRWYVVDWTVPSGTAAPSLRRHTDTTADILVLDSNTLGTVTVRVEALP